MSAALFIVIALSLLLHFLVVSESFIVPAEEVIIQALLSKRMEFQRLIYHHYGQSPEIIEQKFLGQKQFDRIGVRSLDLFRVKEAC